MKNQLLFVVLALLVVYGSCAFVKLSPAVEHLQEPYESEVARPTGILGRNLVTGVIRDGDTILDRGYHVRHASGDGRVQQEILYQAIVPATRINYISVISVAGTPSVTTEIVSGGVGHNNVLIRLTSLPRQGYAVWLEIWGRDS